MAEVPVYGGRMISIDAGGTKTLAVLYDRNGNVLKKTEEKTCHPMNTSEEDIISVLSQCMLDESSDVVLGCAGYGRSKELKQKIERCVKKACGGHHVCIISDMDMALEAALEGKDGLAVILGTGSIAVLRENGRMVRSGGWGFLLGDEGSGYEIGRSVLRSFARMADGRMEKDGLYEAVMRQCSFHDPNELIERAVENGKVNRSFVASFARLALKHIEWPSAREAVEYSARQAALLIASLAEPELPAVATGGLSKSARYMDCINALLPAEIRIVSARNEPVYGGFIVNHKKKAS